ncbi:MAG: amidohydrolase family protein [Bryobacterales bacterium]|nr:amidohydrolase family protein [Bryobacterales bacterium]
MHRRSFLAGLASLADAAPKPPATRIVDVHTHFYDPTRPQGVPWPGKQEPILYRPSLPGRFMEVAGPLGVTDTVVVEASPWLEDNQWVLDLAKDNPVIVGLVGHLSPGTPEFAAQLARFSKDRLFLGIRVGSGPVIKGTEAFLSDMERLAGANLELDVAGAPNMYAALVRLTDRLPGLRIVINHLPHDAPEDKAARAAAWSALHELGKRPQVYAKVSGVLRRVDGRVPDDLGFYRKGLDELWSIFGPTRLVYASNWPVSDLLAPYATVLKVVSEYFTRKGKEACERFFWRNSVAAYRWVNRG